MTFISGGFSPLAKDVHDAELSRKNGQADLDRLETQELRLRACRERYIAEQEADEYETNVAGRFDDAEEGAVGGVIRCKDRKLDAYAPD